MVSVCLVRGRKCLVYTCHGAVPRWVRGAFRFGLEARSRADQGGRLFERRSREFPTDPARRALQMVARRTRPGEAPCPPGHHAVAIANQHRPAHAADHPATTTLPRMPTRLDLSLQFTDSKAAVEHKAQVTRAKAHRWMSAALEGDAEITVRIVGEAEGRVLNRQYRGKDYATNVLTFDYAREPVVMADLVLCAPVVAREARAQRKPLAEHYAHLMIHGTLHAQGWDHETSDMDAEAMETLESLLMLSLGLPDPYA